LQIWPQNDILSSMATENPASAASYMDSHVINGMGEPIALRDPREILARERLGVAVRRQSVVQASDFFEGYAEDPLGTFSKGPLYASTFDEMLPEVDRLYTSNTSKPDDIYIYSGRMMGRLLEQIGYGVLSQRFRRNGHVVISPEETLHIMKALHPEVPIDTIGGVQKSIPGVWVPDGLVVDPKTNTVVQALDYTTNLGQKVRGDSLGNAHVALTHTRILKDASLTLVHPEQKLGEEGKALLNGTKTIPLPFSSSDFRAIEARMLREVLVKLGYLARDVDIKDRREYQDGLYKILRRQGSSVMTPTYAAYGERRGLGETKVASEY
jgi:hypothetical protein